MESTRTCGGVSSTDYRAQTYEVVVDWVSTTLDVGQMGAWEAIE